MNFLLITLSLFLSTQALSKTPTLNMPDMNVTGIVDEELVRIERELEEVKIYNKNGTKKVEKLNQVQQHVSELIPKQIELTKDRKNLNKMIDAKNKYIGCISTKDEEDCQDFKDDLEKLNIRSTENNPNVLKTHILNRHVLREIKRCSDVTKEFFSDFRAVITMDIEISSQGVVQSISLNDDDSVLSKDLPSFSRCVVQFSKKLLFYNPYGDVAHLKQSLMFGHI